MIRTSRWAVAGALAGALLALVVWAPASLAAQLLARSTNGHLQLSDARGSVWNGSGLLVFSGGAGSRGAVALPDRLHWRTQWSGLSFIVHARQDCCIKDELELRLSPGWGRMDVAVKDGGEGLLRWPAALLGGLGTPWNTLEPNGQLRLTVQGLSLHFDAQGWRQQGRVAVDLVDFSSRVSTLSPLGSYRLSLAGAPEGNTLQLQTLQGALQLQGSGRIDARGAQFRGEATAAEGREAALDNLLNIIGQRQGARSLISLG
ncbi:type II secretion system protein N [Burkholderiaceae bacterium UC74_6]